MLRADVLSGEPLCRACREVGVETIATDVDHVTPVSRGGSFWDRSNLQPLCATCHGRKTRAERTGGA